MILALILTLHDAHAQACVCSRNIALPSGAVSRPGEVVVGLDYGLSLSGDGDRWQGLSVTDRYGDSMAGMFMAPHFVQTGSLTATVGLPKGFALSSTLPYLIIQHVGESEMPGDVDSSALADVDLTAKWSWLAKDKRSFFGAATGLTFPTGEVVADSPVRSGRGTFGSTARVDGGWKASPKLAVLGSLTGGTGFGADPTGYVVGRSASLALGTRGSLRENGKLNLAGFGLLRWQGTDRQDALVYKNTGFLTADLAFAAGWTFWEKALRSASLSAKIEAPVWQVVGDPMYAENVAGSLGVSAVVW